MHTLNSPVTHNRSVRHRQAPSSHAHKMPDLDALLDSILREQSIRSLYQPIVEIESRRAVGYEALARGPSDSPLSAPNDLFAAARAADRVADLDWACRGAALEGALEAHFTEPLTLFVNVEPEALDQPVPARLLETLSRVSSDLRIVIEITERALAARPAELLRTAQRVRARGWGIALDDMGADRHSLALMPFLRPDVVKLDLRLIQARPSTEIAEIVNAVNAEVERTGAVVLAEGVEDEGHLGTATAMGATLAQGWMFGRPEPLPAPLSGGGPEIDLLSRGPHQYGGTPVEVLEGNRPLRRATKRHLLSVSRHLEDQAAGLGEATVLLSGFQTRERFAPSTRRRYGEIAKTAAFVGAFGVQMGDDPETGVRGAAVSDDDPMVDEWDVAVVAPHFAALLAARDLGDGGPDLDRRFEFAVTYDRDLVIEAASALMARMAPILPV